MNKISIIYYSSTGNTKEMAEALEEGIKAANGSVELTEISQVNVENVFSSDVIAMGSPACGAEVIEESYFEPFMENEGENFKGKKVFLFGSYGWGGGEYANNWRERLVDLGAIIVADPILALENPNASDLEKLKEMGEKLVTI